MLAKISQTFTVFSTAMERSRVNMETKEKTRMRNGLVIEEQISLPRAGYDN
jgi:hypothetical protein